MKRYSFSGAEFDDEPERPVEERLNEAFLRIYPMIVRDRQEARRAEEQARLAAIAAAQRAELELVRREQAMVAEAEKRKRDTLLEDASNWHKANLIRAYVRHAVDSGRGPQSEEDADAWEKWALQVAEALDPTVK